MLNYKIIVFGLLCFGSIFALTVNVTGNPSFDTDNNTVTTNVSAIGGGTANKTFVATDANYGINGTFATPYASISNANYTTIFGQTGIALVGNLTQGYVNSTGSKVAVCSNVGITLPTSPTAFTCNVTAVLIGNTNYFYTDVLAAGATSVFSYDYAGVEITAGSTVITSLPAIINSGSYVMTSNLTSTNASAQAITFNASNTNLDCQGFSLTGSYTNLTYGIAISGVNNETVQNCVVRNYGTALIIVTGNQSTIINNTFYNSSQTDTIVGSGGYVQDLNFTRNFVSQGDRNGIELFNCNLCNVHNNTFSFHDHGHGTDRHIQFVTNVFNTNVTNNIGFNATFAMRADNNNMSNITVANNNFFNNSNGLNEQAIVVNSIYSNILFQNNIFSGGTGPDITHPAGTTTAAYCLETNFVNNTVSLNLPYAWYNKANGENQTISNLNVGGLGVCDADNIRIINLTTTSNVNNYNEFMVVENISVINITCNNARSCLRILSSNDSIYGNMAITGGALSVINSAGTGNNRNIFENFSISNITVFGAIGPGGSNNTYRNGIIKNSNTTTPAISFSSATIVTGNLMKNISIYNMTGGILFTLSSNNTLQDFYLENITTPILVNSSSSGNKSFTMINMTIAQSGGINRSSFDLVETTLTPNEIYYINSYPTTFPLSNTSYLSFLNKYLNITNTGAVNASFDLNLTWSPSESSTYDESRLSWWASTGGAWSQVVATLDTTNNKLSFSNFPVPATSSVNNGIFYLDMCPIVNASGSYSQKQNYVGAPNPGVSIDVACVFINASNVVWDCSSFNISNNGSGSSPAGIQITGGSNNVSIKNCLVQTYFYGAFSASNSNGNFTNNTFRNNSAAGIYLDTVSLTSISNNTLNLNGNGIDLVFGDTLNNITNNNFLSNTIRAIDISSSSNTNNLISNVLTSNNIGATFLSSNFNNFSNNNISSGSFYAIQIANSGSNIITGNRLLSNVFGIDLSSSANSNTISYNFINATSSSAGISIDGSNANIISFNNLTLGSLNGLTLGSSSFSNRINNNLAQSNTLTGFQSQGTSELFANNTASGNGQAGFEIDGTTNIIYNNTATGNANGFYYLAATNSNSSFNTANANLQNGFELVNISSGIYFLNDTATTNLNSGFAISRATNTRITNCTAQGALGLTGSGISDSGLGSIIEFCSISSNPMGLIEQGNNSIVRNNSLSLNNPTLNDIGLGFIPGGIIAYRSVNATFSGNDVFSNPSGIGSSSSTNSILSNNFVHNNTVGLAVVNSTSFSTSNNQIYLSTLGLNGTNSNITGSGSQFYNNTNNVLDAISSSAKLNATMQIGTNSSVFYNFTYASNTASPQNLRLDPYFASLTLPTNISLIRNMYLNVTNSNQSNFFTTYWTIAEDINDTEFGVYYTTDLGNWTKPTQTLDSSGNSIVVTNTPQGIYALFRNTTIVPPSPSGGSGFVVPFLPGPINESNTTNVTTPPLSIIDGGQMASSDWFTNLKEFAYANNQLCLPVSILIVVILLLRGRK